MCVCKTVTFKVLRNSETANRDSLRTTWSVVSKACNDRGGLPKTLNMLVSIETVTCKASLDRVRGRSVDRPEWWKINQSTRTVFLWYFLKSVRAVPRKRYHHRCRQELFKPRQSTYRSPKHRLSPHTPTEQVPQRKVQGRAWMSVDSSSRRRHKCLPAGLGETSRRAFYRWRWNESREEFSSPRWSVAVMILPHVHLRKHCNDFYFF